jgi:type I restriction enzyme S subunit
MSSAAVAQNTTTWEQRRLGDIAERYKNMLVTPSNGYWRLGVRSHAKGTFTTYVLPGNELGEAELSRVVPDNLIVNIVFAWEHAVSITKNEDAKALVSHRFPQFRFHGDMVPTFFRYAILDERFRHHLWLSSPSGAGRNKTLSIEEMLKYEFTLPGKDEQEKIGAFFTALDHLITLHQRELVKLKNVKKSLLEKMFLSTMDEMRTIQ